jgi:uncharacterized phiE125 gp8 family phage protein
VRVTVVTPPQPFVTLDEAKEHLRVLDEDSDALIEAYIAAACAHIDGPDGWLGRAIGVQELEVRGAFFGGCRWTLPFPPVIEVTGVTYLDSDGAEQTLATDQYEVRGREIVPAYGITWPSVRSDRESVRVAYSAGYDEVPAPIKAAVLLMVGDMFAFRETAAVGITIGAIPMSTTVEYLLSPYRVLL